MIYSMLNGNNVVILLFYMYYVAFKLIVFFVGKHNLQNNYI